MRIVEVSASTAGDQPTSAAQREMSVSTTLENWSVATAEK
jgi:hypothetical protein